MAKLSEINWDMVKFEFEVLGATLEDLEEKYEVAPALMKYNARNWAPCPATKQKELAFTKLEDIETLTDEIASQVKQESEIVSLVKQKFLLPKYVHLEQILLEKTITLATSLEATDRASANAIKTLASVLRDLLAHNPILAPQETELTKSDEPMEWKVTYVDARASDTEKAETVPGEEKTV
jgi:hypothetical protein